MNKEDILKKLRNLHTIRSQAYRLLELAQQNKLKYFSLDAQQLPATASYISEVIMDNYPSLEIPYHSRWRHFEAGNIDRIKELRQHLNQLSTNEQGKLFFELVIISVLLDAGAGKDWSYHEKKTGQRLNRSEGLAVASLELYLSGAFSKDAKQPWRVDGRRLLSFTKTQLEESFQVSTANPLEGIDGRLSLLNRLGSVIGQKTEFFGPEGRLGNFYSHITSYSSQQETSVQTLFESVLSAFTDIWPKRLQLANTALGDVWTHTALKTEAQGSEYIPFHKLSQWLTYSLIEPLQWTGFHVNDIDLLTGLPEYRNGGLLVDMGLLKAKSDNVLNKPHRPESELIVEWRGLTVALLDELAERIRDHFKLDAEKLPLAKILQGGTWEAGRRIAAQKRTEGTPPIQIISDGTVF
ncbi:DUF1688 family protein [Legionella israelensis]|uniref:URC4/urg3 family protein n=1 Tax=Legionella israelensis TaxID=454 RepID=UPI00118011BF|nr:URC4/urg3 family protein [Legionella israelensis]QDP73383.1 DUF1688 family protein [Legionella israelensis]